MNKKIASIITYAFLLVVLSACSVDMQLDMQVKVDGKPVEAAQISVDGEKLGVTGKDGRLSQLISKRPDKDIILSVDAAPGGYRTKSWTKTFVAQKPKESKQVETYAFVADLEFTKRYFTVKAVEEDGKPVAGANIKIGDTKVGETDEQGNFVYEYDKAPKRGFDILVSKGGLTVFRSTGKVEEGALVTADMYKPPVINVVTSTEYYGDSPRLSSVDVYMDGKKIGRTDKNGKYSYVSTEKPGRKVRLTFAKDGYISLPSTTVLKGKQNIASLLYPQTESAIRIGVLPLTSNSPGVFLNDVISAAEKSLSKYLVKEGSFVEVDRVIVEKAMKRSNMSVKKITSTGWNNTALRDVVDMILVGSVAQDEDGSISLEGKIYSSSGSLLLSQIARERDAKDADDAGSKVGVNLVDNFPFESHVISVDGGMAKINMGTKKFDLDRSEVFEVSRPKFSGSGQLSGYSVLGQAQMNSRDDLQSIIKPDANVAKAMAMGLRVVRSAEGDTSSTNTLNIVAKGGVESDVSALPGVNVYLGDRWAGVTDSSGKAVIKVRKGKSYDLVLYKHGYQKAGGEVLVNAASVSKEYVLKANNSMFTIASEPSGASVYVDDEKVGVTPIATAVPITLGFHKVRVTLGGDTRDWEDIVEFGGKSLAMTGSQSITIYKDYLRLGDELEAKGNIDGAIAMYSKASKGHPDYAESKTRLAQLYLDEKSDYDAAIKEYSAVVELPEVQQLVLKQFAIVYTNLGHAQYEKGNSLINSDKQGAATYLAAAIKSLENAKGNVRFFPTESYDDAVHDTYYYAAISYHKLYGVTKNKTILDKADQAWQEYFDFYPESFKAKPEYMSIRNAAQKMWDQLAEKR